MGAIKNTRNAQKTQLDVCIGKEGLPVGELAYVKDGAREYSVFAYSQDWLRHPAHFAISPDLALVSGHQVRKPPTKSRQGTGNMRRDRFRCESGWVVAAHIQARIDTL